uniref:ATP synthase F(1) complex subunit delta, mitochondrial n=1 Tax=Corvus moneduloides TaxID=1196302 RepID=A0A8U7NMB4_CORMO
MAAMFCARRLLRLARPALPLPPARGYAEPAGGPAAMAFTFASPTQVFYNGASVKQVDVPTLTGSFGILASHVPTLQVLRPGVVTVHAEDGTATKYFGERGRRSWAGKVCVGMVFLALSQGRLCPSGCGLVHFQGFLLSQPARGSWKLLWEPWAGVRSWFCSGFLGASPAPASHGMGAEFLNVGVPGNVTGGGQGFVLGKDGEDAKADPPHIVPCSEQRLCQCPRRLHSAGAGRGGSDHGHAGPGCEYSEIVASPGLPPWRGFAPLLCSGVLVLGASCAQNPGLCLTPTTFWDQRLGAPPW